MNLFVFTCLLLLLLVYRRDIYVNINMLYIEIDRDPDLRKAQYPVLMAVSLYILSGTDFFGDFTGDEYALFFYMNWEKCVWDTWVRANWDNLLPSSFFSHSPFVSFFSVAMQIASLT